MNVLLVVLTITFAHFSSANGQSGFSPSTLATVAATDTKVLGGYALQPWKPEDMRTIKSAFDQYDLPKFDRPGVLLISRRERFYKNPIANGVKALDIITRVGRHALTNPGNYAKAFDALKDGETDVTVKRVAVNSGGRKEWKTLRVTVTPVSAKAVRYTELANDVAAKYGERPQPMNATSCMADYLEMILKIGRTDNQIKTYIEVPTKFTNSVTPALSRRNSDEVALAMEAFENKQFLGQIMANKESTLGRLPVEESTFAQQYVQACLIYAEACTSALESK